MSDLTNPQSYLEEKILALKGMTKQQSKDGSIKYIIGNEELAHIPSPGVLRVRLSEVCRQKIGTALKGEPRATLTSGGDSVELRFTDDIDVEFVFLYVRFAWKYR